LRKKNKVLKESLTKEKFEAMEPLLLQIEEGKKIQKSMNQQLNEKVQECEKLEGEVVLLTKGLGRAKTQLIFN